MQTKQFAYQVRSVKNGVARLVAFYDKDCDQRPPAILVHTDAFTEGQEVEMAFIMAPANHHEIMG